MCMLHVASCKWATMMLFLVCIIDLLPFWRHMNVGGIVKNTLRPPIPPRCDPEWRKLMEECWSPDPNRRPSFTEITCRLRSMSMALQAKPHNQVRHATYVVRSWNWGMFFCCLVILPQSLSIISKHRVLQITLILEGGAQLLAWCCFFCCQYLHLFILLSVIFELDHGISWLCIYQFSACFMIEYSTRLYIGRNAGRLYCIFTSEIACKMIHNCCITVSL